MNSVKGDLKGVLVFATRGSKVSFSFMMHLGGDRRYKRIEVEFEIERTI